MFSAFVGQFLYRLAEIWESNAAEEAGDLHFTEKMAPIFMGCPKFYDTGLPTMHCSNSSSPTEWTVLNLRYMATFLW